jgi:hypothetical protein
MKTSSEAGARWEVIRENGEFLTLGGENKEGLFKPDDVTSEQSHGKQGLLINPVFGRLGN